MLLELEQLHLLINEELGSAAAEHNLPSTLAAITSGTTLNPLSLDLEELLEQLRQDNKDTFPEICKKLTSGYLINEDNLLLYTSHLEVQCNILLCTQLIQKAHSQPSTAHPDSLKTYQLLSPDYYWIGIQADCKHFVRNCLDCLQSHPQQTKQQGFLHPLPVSEYTMQHLTMDFKSMSSDKHSYDSILVFMDRLGKDSVTILCYKTTDTRGLARLYIDYIYQFGHTPESIISDCGLQFVSFF